MKKLFIATVMLCASTIGLSAQNSKGGISEDMLKEISKGYTGSAEQKAVRNALAVNPISELSVNAENLSMCDTYFSHQVKTKGITNQLSSGRCWLFTGLNVLRAKMIDKYELPEMVFSHNYLSFHDLLEKSNLFLQAIIDTRNEAIDSRQVEWLLKSPIGDGGQFTGVSNLIMKYGVVPKSAMPETYQSNNTDEMRNILKLKLREYALALRAADSEKSAMALKTQMLTEIYRILAECVGVPPTEFEWTRYDKDGKPVSTKTYTPKSFYQEYIGADLENNYVMVMNDPSREYYKVYEIDLDRHVYDGENWVYVNLPIEKIKEMAIASIKDNTAMYFSCDVRKFWNKDKGTLDLNNIDYASLFRTSFPMTKKERIQTFASGSTHAMTLIAVDLDEQGTPKKWMV